MGTTGITYGNINEVVFENRFRQYGAYMLRKTYSDRLFTAALIGTAFITLLIAFPFAMQLMNKTAEPEQVLDKGTVTISQIIDLTKEKIAVPKDLPKPKPQSTPSKGVSSNIVPSDKPEPSHVNLINDSLQAGDPNGKDNKKEPEIKEPEKKDIGNGTTNDDDVKLVAEENPAPTCDIKQHIANNLMYPAYAKDIGIQGTVYVSFVVDQQGNITDVKVLRDIGYGCGEAAMNAVKSMCKWKPGKMGGKPVKVLCNLPIKFTLH